MRPIEPIHRAGQWFLRSGIQEQGGGVARYHRSDLGRNAPVSNEITGYSVSTLLYLAARTGNPDYQTAAQRAGHYLVKHAWDSEARTFPFEPASNGSRLAYFFDCGIIVRGLTALAKVDGGNGAASAACAAAHSMARVFAAPTGWHPVLSLPACAPLPYEPRWSRQPGCYQLKSALAWLETGDSSSYEAALEFAFADEAGFLPGALEPERVMDRLHPYCYFLEGLLPVADRPEATRTLVSGIKRVECLLREIAPAFARSDVYAQLLRVRLFADALGAVPLDEAAAAEEAAAIPTFQVASDDPRTDGCFSFGRRLGELMPYANPVSTAFCLQAMEMWNDHRENRFTSDWRTLI
ncbi:MAG TPA: hypothetical protein VN428_05570 [Bryobacteraceae bacterium]|nr:hypothetical protein [Bryobacteraceae bacterium]